jgi:TPR repeat protein
LTRARIYHEKACTFGNAVGCISAGFAYLEGREVRKSPEKALKYFNKAAELGEPAAAAGAIATVILTERWTNRYSEVFQLLEKSCQLDCARSCLILGNLYTTGRLVSPDKQKARNFWQKACDLSDAQACEKYNQ